MSGCACGCYSKPNYSDAGLPNSSGIGLYFGGPSLRPGRGNYSYKPPKIGDNYGMPNDTQLVNVDLSNYSVTPLSTSQYNPTAEGQFIIKRVPRAQLGGSAGAQVLGKAYVTNMQGMPKVIEIADDLQGEQYQEVLKHEVNHHIHPELGEQAIRDMTRDQLYKEGKATYFH